MMGERELSLDFATLRRANTMRLPQFKNPKGEPAHKEPDGSDWALSAWCNAVCGELGEAANLIKKIERGDFTLEEAREALGKEFADIATYLDILAMRAGIDLGEAIVGKFNEVSERVGSSVRIAALPGGALVAGHARAADEEIERFNRTYDANAARRHQYDESETKHGPAPAAPLKQQ